MNSFLILFTSEFPYGRGEAYLESEIKYLAAAFSKIVIVSNAEQPSDIRILPSNVEVLTRPYGLSPLQKLLSFGMIFKTDFWKELLFVKSQYKLPLNTTVVNTILLSLFKSYQVERFLIDKLTPILDTGNTLCYSYWADDNAVSLALMNSRGYRFKSICRTHRWDVYFEKNGSGYLPFRKALADNLSAIYFVAQNGLDYFKAKTGLNLDKLQLARLGTYPLLGCELSDKIYDLHLLSCSFVIDRKRVHKIAEALQLVQLDIRVKWTHIGSGPGIDKLRQLCQDICRMNPNISIELPGTMPNASVKDFYSKNYVDLFINVSESEGVPVSIMEAMSAGVPCLATDVDGVSEIVRDGINGFLLPLSDDSKVISNALKRFYELTPNQKGSLRKGAFKTWEQDYNADKNYEAFIRSITAPINRV